MVFDSETDIVYSDGESYGDAVRIDDDRAE